MSTESQLEDDNLLSTSPSNEERYVSSLSPPSDPIAVSNFTIFKYCLGGLIDRTIILKELAISASDEQIRRFAHDVCIYSGCHHHGHQIRMAKQLIEEGTDAWHSITHNNHTVHWGSAVVEIEERFMKISNSRNRSLREQDVELLKTIAGCQDYMAQENFEKMWCWLYPIANTLSKSWMKGMWSSLSPKWIEGFITKEEAELSLHHSHGLLDPGVFLLRFPTSRSWPHPDAGSLVVTYIGFDYAIHHRLISFDHTHRFEEEGAVDQPLQDMLLSEPELSHLGKVIR